MRGYLKILRGECKKTQQNVADNIGVSRQYYNLIENGNRQQRMDIQLAGKLAHALGVSVDYIVSQEARTA